MEKVYLKLGRLIREYREAAGLSQSEVAKQLGYNNPQFLSLVELGRSKVPLNVLGKLTVILKIPEQQVLTMLLEASEISIKKEIHSGRKAAGGN